MIGNSNDAERNAIFFLQIFCNWNFKTDICLFLNTIQVLQRLLSHIFLKQMYSNNLKTQNYVDVKIR